MGESIREAMNSQITHEFESGYFYLGLSSYFDDLDLPGFAHWMRVQAGEERDHALKFFDHMTDRGWRVRLSAIEQPRDDFSSPLDVARAVLENERRVTQLINTMYDIALEEHDYPAQVLLQWFVNEQVEEEKSASQIVADLERAGDDASALLLIDARLGARSSTE